MLEEFESIVSGKYIFIHPDFWKDIVIIETIGGTVNITSIRGYMYCLMLDDKIIKRLEKEGLVPEGRITVYPNA